MARMQILYLPDREDVSERFALVIDRLTEDETHLLKDGEAVDRFANKCGAVAWLVTGATVDLDFGPGSTTT